MRSVHACRNAVPTKSNSDAGHNPRGRGVCAFEVRLVLLMMIDLQEVNRWHKFCLITENGRVHEERSPFYMEAVNLAMKRS